MASERSPSRAVMAVATVALAGALFAALLPFTSGGVNLDVGDIAFRTVRAPEDISFVSDALTAKRRDEAAAAVPDSLVYDPSVAVKQQAGLNTLLNRVSSVRDDPSLNQSSKAAALSRIENLSLSQASTSLVLSLSPDDWQVVQTEARRTLGSILDLSLPPSQVADARERVLNNVDPSF